MEYNNNKRSGRVVDRKEQALISAVASELINNTKIDYYPEENAVKIRYFGPKQMTITMQEISARVVTEFVR